MYVLMLVPVKTVSPELAAAMAIEEEENQRELTERIRKKEIIEQDEYTESQIR